MAVKKAKRPGVTGSGKKGGRSMLEIMQQNVLLYGIAVLGIWGVASQIILRIVYDKLIHDMEKPAFAKGKYVKHLKQKYNVYKRIQSGTDNVNIFIQKSLMEYKFLGMNLHTWRRMGGAVFVLCAVVGAVGWYFAGTLQLAEEIRQNYLWAVLASALLIAGAYGVTDTGYRRKYLETGLRSLFSGSSAQTIQTADLPEQRTEAVKEEVKPERKPFPIRASAEKKKRGKSMETKAQRDKRELKENLAKLKEGAAETAAAEGSRKRNTEILQQMDPAEQERVIREVLKEFL